jgi:superfamily I DNA/RNA helicase
VEQLRDAALAVREEHRDSSKWKKLRCRKVSVFSERGRGIIYVLDVGPSVEFDWTWEGAKAFRPTSGDGTSPSNHESVGNQESVGNLWAGEIVEVDERNGSLFVSLDNTEMTPTAGNFFVKPYEFLSVLDAVYNGPEFEVIQCQLPARLNAAAGSVHPRVSRPQAKPVGLPDLQAWWQHSWSILWGPPGTGKTYTTGRQVAAVLACSDERVLVVSTTNRATDAVAISIGNAATKLCPAQLENENLLRIGKGAAYPAFVESELQSMLKGTESEFLAKLAALTNQLHLFESLDDKALTRQQIGELRASGSDNSNDIFVDSDKRVVIATAFKAMTYLRDDSIRKTLEQGSAPFTTIFIDEAGLMSRTAISALSLLASRRVVLVGDSKQLAPISRISRTLPTRQQNWLASSGLSHLDDIESTPQAVHVLSEQRRMHPDVCKVVSNYQYDGFLTTADDRVRQSAPPSNLIENYSRAIWYVLDNEGTDLASIRASRGPGNKSWVRPITQSILLKLFSDSAVQSASGLFISPFRAQAQAMAKLFAKWGVAGWEASTVHSQQGSEADLVIFDTVNAGSYNWPVEEWKRLVNVAISRAREAVVVIASRSEMAEPYLRPLLGYLRPGILTNSAGEFVWQDSAPHFTTDHPSAVQPELRDRKTQATFRMGDQFTDRKSMKPVFTQEQQRLAHLELDGKPRLVRGVAGSGKSVVLSSWLAKTAMRLQTKKDAQIWAVYANRSLHRLLRESIESAWDHHNEADLLAPPPFPWNKVTLLHVRDVLAGLLPSANLSMDAFGFDYDRAAAEFLNREDASKLLPRCTALFIDEAQDMGASTIKLLLSIVEQADESDANSRPAHIFYDNAQNIYGTKTPKWSDLGIDLRGRTTIMRESFRSTKPITELAVNVLHRLTDSTDREDQKELLSMGMLEQTSRRGEEWFHVRFNQVNGPKPIFRTYNTASEEIDGICSHLKFLIQQERISPNDICLIYNGKGRNLLEERLAPKLLELDVELSVQTNRTFERQPNTLIATTPHSYKGYESEVVLIPFVDHYVAGEGKILANCLYVAMTRARSLLGIYGVNGGSVAARKLSSTITSCINALNSPPEIEAHSEIDDAE